MKTKLEVRCPYCGHNSIYEGFPTVVWYGINYLIVEYNDDGSIKDAYPELGGRHEEGLDVDIDEGSFRCEICGNHIAVDGYQELAELILSKENEESLNEMTETD